MMVYQTGPNQCLPKGHELVNIPWSSQYHPHISWLKHPMVREKKHINWKAHESSIYFLPKINLEFAGIILLAEVFS